MRLNKNKGVLKMEKKKFILEQLKSDYLEILSNDKLHIDTKNRALTEFLDLIATYDLGMGDLQRIEHWAKGPKILDLGWAGGFADRD